MKLPITDQFLWKVFTFIQDADKAYDFVAPRTMKEAVYPDLLRIRREIGRRDDWKRFSQLVYYLKRNGYIAIKNLQSKQAVLLTPRGIERVVKLRWKIEGRRKRKDGKWQMIIFDVPERRKRHREVLRDGLCELGYQRLQDSVWICPYDVAKETELFLRQNDLDSYVHTFLIEEIEV